MSAPERVRAYLTARSASPEPNNIFAEQGIIARHGKYYLTDSDVTDLLSYIDAMSRMIAEQNDTEPSLVLQMTEYAIHVKPVSRKDLLWDEMNRVLESHRAGNATYQEYVNAWNAWAEEASNADH